MKKASISRQGESLESCWRAARVSAVILAILASTSVRQERIATGMNKMSQLSFLNEQGHEQANRKMA
jgi:hypothetical protein